jgi:S-formylglutathione hydrolase FrmB
MTLGAPGRPARRRTYIGRRASAAAALALAVLIALVGFRTLGTNTQGAQIIRFTIKSPLVHATMPVAAVVPASASGQERPLLIFLHGKGGNENSSLSPQLFAALAALGSRAPDVVFPYGGPDSYWHNRADGAWGSYVMDEVIPQAIARLGADPTRIAIGGVSMGGFGALNLARLYPKRFCAVGGHSAAIWTSGGYSAPGAFDNAEDFARNNVIGAARAGNPYPGLAVWIDAGSEDPFRSADTTLAQLLHTDGVPVQFHIWPGVHSLSYWDSHWSNYLQFYATALANCHST